MLRSQIEDLAQRVGEGRPVSDSLGFVGMDRMPFMNPGGHYVYLLIDPRTDEGFYVGKGKGDRANWHAYAEKRGLERGTPKTVRIKEIREEGLSPEIIVLAKDLSESEALDLESAFIEKAFDRLTNIGPGQRGPKDRYTDQLTWCMGVFRETASMTPPEGMSTEEWKALHRDFRSSCERLLAADVSDDDLSAQARQNRRAVVDGRLTKIELEKCLNE